MKCASCGTDNRDGIRFCETCGAALNAAVAQAESVVVEPGPTCPSCQTVNRVGVRFCEACGAALTVERAKPIAVMPGLTCPNCQTANRAGIRFCETCGTQLETRRVTAPPPRPSRVRVWRVLAIAAGLVITALAVFFVVRLFQPPVTRGEALRMAESIVERDFAADLADVKPAWQRYQGIDGTVYGFDYVTDVKAETDDGEVTVSSGVVVTINQYTGEIEIIGVR